MRSEGRIEKCFQRFIDRVMDGSVVPFLGAGISTTAKTEPGLQSRPNIQKVGVMCRSIITALWRHCKERYEYENCKNCHIGQAIFCYSSSRKSSSYLGPVFCLPLKIKDDTLANSTMAYHGCTKKVQYLNNLTKICEMWEQKCGEQTREEARLKLVETILQVPEFVHLAPTPAHRYIAYLVRENLMGEVITTNYDHCMEKAYEQSLIYEYKGEKDKPWHSVCDLENYRRYGGIAYQEDTEQRNMRVLKVYKINGNACSKDDLGKKKYEQKKEWAQTILLTDGDLQNWRQRHWAEDLFHDRMRSRTLIFCGFGSEEPQIRHTVLQLCEEVSASGSGKEEKADSIEAKVDTGDKDVWFERHNAPYIQVYEDVLSFNQYQILHAFIIGNNKEQKELNSWKMDNVFSKQDAASFKAEKADGLSADVFWQRVYQAVFGRLLWQVTLSQSDLMHYFNSTASGLSQLWQDFVYQYYPDDVPFGNLEEILRIGDTSARTLLSDYLYCVRYGEEGRQGVYMPFTGRKVLMGTMLLVFYMLLDKLNAPPHQSAGLQSEGWSQYISCDRSGLGLLIKQEQLPAYVCIAHTDLAREVPQRIPVDLKEFRKLKAFVQIIIGEGCCARKNQLALYDNNDETKIQMHELYQIPFQHIFRRGGYSGYGMDTCVKELGRCLRYPGEFVR